MKVLINLPEPVLEFFKERAEKNKRSRKSEMEIFLTSFALKESFTEVKEEYFKPVIIKPIRVTLENTEAWRKDKKVFTEFIKDEFSKKAVDSKKILDSIPKVSKADQLRKLRGNK